MLWNKDTSIIRSALETDVYKILMLYYIWTYYPYLKVKWAFKNRKVDIPLGKFISEDALKEQLQAVTALRFSDADIEYLRSWEMFSEPFLKKLQNIRLDMPHVSKRDDGQLVIEVSGTWFETTLSEIYILAIVAELYLRGRAQVEGISEGALYDEGVRRLEQKIEFLNAHPILKFALFGLRRRASGPWEDFLTEQLLTKTQSVTGTSNVYLAKQFKVTPIGTNAHELPMAEYAVSRHMGPVAVRQSPYEVLRKWERLYGHKALIMLSDTFGTDAFLRDLPSDIAVKWQGHRQDSGDAVLIGEKIIADYERRSIDPSEKRILFTDGLDLERMLKLHETFAGRIGVGFGIGTFISNDLGLIPALSIVMKLVEAAGNETVKLSDNIAKAMGSKDEVALAKKIFGYTNRFTQATTY
ncbi:MAG: nicotinate phosphoribosyltransferase [Patescibacteria group bacterium]